MRADHQQTGVFIVNDMTQVGAARRRSASFAQELGLEGDNTGRVSTIVTELARNIVLHAGSGQIVIGPTQDEAIHGVAILAMDRGPGMQNISRCMEDGYSTAGTPGTGLGAVRRMSDFFDIYSMPNQGTVIVSCVMDRAMTGQNIEEAKILLGSWSVPMPGEEICGDCWAIRRDPAFQIIVADGLGHGPVAAEASSEMIEVFHRERERPLTGILESAHETLRATRGAAVAIAQLDPAAGVVTFAGVGNISGFIHVPGGKTVNMVSHNGTIGAEARRFHEFTYSWPDDGLVVLHSDGLTSQAGIEAFQGLAMNHPSTIAGMLLNHFRRERDDATVVVARRRREDNEFVYS